MFPNTTITLGVLIALGMVVIGFYVLHYTRFGRTVNAIGDGTLLTGGYGFIIGSLLGFIVMQRVITLGRDRGA